jgi:LCP family protein required for cell wall assembly
MTSQKPRTSRSNRALPWIILGVFIVLAIALSAGTFISVRQLVSSWSISSLPGEPVPLQNNQVPGEATPTAGPSQEKPSVKPWDGKSRVNILFLGLDFRDWEAGSTPRTDTMILFSYDPVQEIATTLTIPRDLWVNIPNFDFGKINTAYYLGESYHLPGGGPAEAMQAVSQFLGIPVDYFVQVDFNTFVKMIDLIGGVVLTPDQDVKVERIGNVESQQILKAGEQVTLDGALTLAYARERHTSMDDFDRSRRQQEVIMAIRNRLLQFDNLPKFISRAPALYNEFSSGIKTNLDLQQMIQLGSTIVNLPKENLKQFSISPAEVSSGTSPDGLSILIPIPDDIRAIQQKVFASSGSASPISGNLSGGDVLRQEGARVSVVNASGSSGRGQQAADALASQGVTIASVNENGNYQQQSSLFITNSKPYAIQAIATLFNIDSSRVQLALDPSSQSDLILFIGADWSGSTP